MHYWEIIQSNKNGNENKSNESNKSTKEGSSFSEPNESKSNQPNNEPNENTNNKSKEESNESNTNSNHSDNNSSKVDSSNNESNESKPSQQNSGESNKLNNNGYESTSTPSKTGESNRLNFGTSHNKTNNEPNFNDSQSEKTDSNSIFQNNGQKDIVSNNTNGSKQSDEKGANNNSENYANEETNKTSLIKDKKNKCENACNNHVVINAPKLCSIPNDDKIIHYYRNIEEQYEIKEVSEEEKEKSTSKLREYLNKDASEIDINVIENLILSGCDINTANSRNETALYYAVLFSNFRLVKLLVLNNAILNIENVEGLTPIKLSKSLGQIEIYDYLSSFMDEYCEDMKLINKMLNGGSNGKLN